MQRPARTTRPPVGIMFDTALSGIDDALAMSLLYGFDGRGDVHVYSVTISRPVLQGAVFADVVGRFYAGTLAGSGANTVDRKLLPVGLASTGTLKDNVPFWAGALSRRDTDGRPLYIGGIDYEEDAADPAPVIRNALTTQYDDNSVVVLSGPATSLAALLDVFGAKALIARKVRFLVFAGGTFPGGKAELNITSDIPAARRVLAEWPTPIVMSGREVGDALLFPGESIEKDFTWTTAHPVVDAYRAYRPMPYDAPTPAMTAALYAVRPKEGYFKLSDPGTVTVLDDGRTTFEPSASGRHRHLILDPAQTERIVRTYTEITSAAKPQARTLPNTVRPLPTQKPAPQKPAEPKQPEGPNKPEGKE
jgi:inosine-uridine nucleoside N-ribohydrolase